MSLPQVTAGGQRPMMVAAGKGMGRCASEPLMKSRQELKSKINELVKSAVRERSGPSFEDRLLKAVERKSREQRDTEKLQWQRIRESREKGEQRALAVSPNADMHKHKPNNVQQARALAEKKVQMAAMAHNFREERKAMLDRI